MQDHTLVIVYKATFEDDRNPTESGIDSGQCPIAALFEDVNAVDVGHQARPAGDVGGEIPGLGGVGGERALTPRPPLPMLGEGEESQKSECDTARSYTPLPNLGEGPGVRALHLTPTRNSQKMLHHVHHGKEDTQDEPDSE